MRRVKKLRNGKKREKGTKNGADIAEDPAFRAIVELAKSLQAICRQSYELMDYGMRLFTKLCNAFRSRYPECVADYIKINDELYGDDNISDAAK